MTKKYLDKTGAPAPTTFGCVVIVLLVAVLASIAILVLSSSPIVKAKCGSTPHGGTHTRIKWEAASVNAPSTCQSETQTRTCNDGAWGAWAGNYTEDGCTVKSKCGSTPHGGTHTRIKWQAASVNAPSTCQSETQTRTCND